MSVNHFVDMDSLSEFGCFAYYFNAITAGIVLAPSLFRDTPGLGVVLLLFTTLLSILASKLLVRTIDLHFSEVISQRLLTRNPAERQSALHHPSLMQHSLPTNCLGSTLYVLFFLCVMITLLGGCMTLGINLYHYLMLGKIVGWGGLFILFFIGVLMASSLSLQTMEGVQIASVFIHIACSIAVGIIAPFVPSPSPVFLQCPVLYLPLLIVCLSNQLVIPTVMAASSVSTDRQSSIQTYAVYSIAGLFLAQGIVFGWLRPDFSQTVVTASTHVYMILVLPSIFSFFHIWLRTLADVIIAWRYEMNLMVAQEKYPWRVAAVRALLPLLISLPSIILRVCLGKDEAFRLLSDRRASTLAASTIFLILPYSYYCSVQHFGELVEERQKAPKWWSYVLYAGGTCSIAANLVWMSWTEDLWVVFGIDASIVVLVVLWHAIGRILS